MKVAGARSVRDRLGEVEHRPRLDRRRPAGLLKVLLALKHKILPPTANFESPALRLGMDGSPFRVLSRAEPWPAPEAGRPRRAAVSGFGFGGINAHVLVEEWTGSPGQSRAGHVRFAAPLADRRPPSPSLG